MEREVFRSKPLRGIPPGLISGFMYGCIILFIALALGMNEDMFIPLLGVAVILGIIIGIISSSGKSMEADENGIYVKNKAYLFAENNMYFQVHTHYYHCIPVTERWIRIISRDGEHTVKCSFLGGQDAGRLAKIIEDGMRKNYRTLYSGVELHDANVRSFVIPAAALAEKINQRNKLLVRMTFWSLTVLFSWILISMIIEDELAEYGLLFLLSMALIILILGGTNFFICRRFKKSAQKIPYEIVFSGGTMYIDGKSFGGADITRVVMTQEQGAAAGDMRKLVLYDRNGMTGEYSFGFRYDRNGFPGYGQLVEAVKDNFGEKFAYDIN